MGGLVVDFDNDLTEEPSVTDDGLPNPPGDVNINWWVAVGDVTAVSFSSTNAVEAQRGKKIPESGADALIAEAAAIIEALESE